MHLTFAPMRHDMPLVLRRHGDRLCVNGAELDLSGIPEGAVLPRAAVACDWLAGDIERRDGILHLVLILPHGPDAPEATLFPAPILLTGDGPVTLPPYTALSGGGVA
ncbi:hypothetical protein GEU84_019135 [Fertoebacter nigrum]|uniref:Uncharacterized protein n=1 Tax=Fertoeibacter niger TaxID=2656921 RepID=A0A8X8H0D9_9RHOB|nr:hypothetical protein [Fertoeibacter niger]NUB46512.1 hypothetical protein [Fertoeibacter niger]